MIETIAVVTIFAILTAASLIGVVFTVVGAFDLYDGRNDAGWKLALGLALSIIAILGWSIVIHYGNQETEETAPVVVECERSHCFCQMYLPTSDGTITITGQ